MGYMETKSIMKLSIKYIELHEEYHSKHNLIMLQYVYSYLWQFTRKNRIQTRIEPVGKPDRQVALVSWNDISKMRWS